MYSLEEVPAYFSDFAGITLETAQAILCIAVIMGVMIPLFITAKGNQGTNTQLVILFITICALTGIGWMPFWVLITAVIVLAMAVAMFGTKLITGE